MNRYPIWKYAVVILSIIVSILYILPNFYSSKPAIQISSTKTKIKKGDPIIDYAYKILNKANIEINGSFIDNRNKHSSIVFCFKNNDDQLEAKRILEEQINIISEYNCTIVVLSATSLPKYMNFLYKIGAKPISLGLDLRGGVHFLLEMDIQTVIENAYRALSNDIKIFCNNQNIKYNSIDHLNSKLVISLNNNNDLKKIRLFLRNIGLEGELLKDENLSVNVKLTDKFLQQIKTDAVKQNINIIHKRINELGVSEPIIQQQGLNRIIVQLPGVHDIARAKEILGRTAALELRMVDDSFSFRESAKNGFIPLGLKMYSFPDDSFILIKKSIILTGENIKNAFAGYDSKNRLPVVNIILDDNGTKIFRDITRENINKRLAIILVDNNVEEVITAPVIKSEISEGQVQISGSMSIQEAYDMAILLKSGSLAAPMNIIEEKTVGPTLGSDNINKGFVSTMFGFISIIIFIISYYRLLGLFSAIGLSVNLLLMLSILSIIQATLTLPGIAALALNLGMAIDSNVLINERIREELRNGSIPQEAISKGFDLAWNTILDSNLTSLIIGIALLSFTSGPIRGFAIVHCLGVLTSMFSSVFVVRSLINLWYGYRQNLSSISIGTVWYPNKK